MPDDTTRAFALCIQVRYTFDGGLDSEILLVTGYLLYAAIEEDELISKFEQAGGAASTGPTRPS